MLRGPSSIIISYFKKKILYAKDPGLVRGAANINFKIIIAPQVQSLYENHFKKFQWLKIALGMIKNDVKNVLYVRIWRNELRKLLYFFILLFILEQVYAIHLKFLGLILYFLEVIRK
jgi:hypothetical protein